MNFKVFHIQESVERDHVEGGIFSKLKLLCTTKKYFFPFFLLNCLIVLVLLTGVSTMNVYANEMFQRAGGHMNRYLSNIIIGLLQLAGSCLFLPLVKIYSRKQLFASSALTMAASLSLLGLYLYAQTRCNLVIISSASRSQRNEAAMTQVRAVLRGGLQLQLAGSPLLFHLSARSTRWSLLGAAALHRRALPHRDARAALRFELFSSQGHLVNTIVNQASPSPWPPPPPWSPR